MSAREQLIQTVIAVAAALCFALAYMMRRTDIGNTRHEWYRARLLARRERIEEDVYWQVLRESDVRSAMMITVARALEDVEDLEEQQHVELVISMN